MWTLKSVIVTERKLLVKYIEKVQSTTNIHITITTYLKAKSSRHVCLYVSDKLENCRTDFQKDFTNECSD